MQPLAVRTINFLRLQILAQLKNHTQRNFNYRVLKNRQDCDASYGGHAVTFVTQLVTLVARKIVRVVIFVLAISEGNLGTSLTTILPATTATNF